MSNTAQQALFRAVMTLFRPLARILIRNGVAYGAFAELAKKAYVDVTFEEFGEASRKQTVSRVSAITGLTRKETKRLHELENYTDTDAAERYNRAVRVISGWVNDNRYQNDSGEPKQLPVSGTEPSFTSLVKEYSGDIPTQAMLAVLKKAGCVEETQQGNIQLLSHAFVPGDDSVDKLHILGTDVAELLTTIDYNLTSGQDQLFYQRKVSNTNLRDDSLPAFRKLSAKKAQALLENLDAWLSDHEISENPTTQAAQGRYVSLGIYYSEHPPSKETSS